MYFDREQEQDRLRFELEWDGLVGAGDLVVLDEAQCWPEVFPKLDGAIEGNRARRGRFFYALLEYDPATALFVHPWAGASWEAWVIELIIVARTLQAVPFQVSYCRTSDGLECDLVVDMAGFREVIEIKLTSSPTLADFGKLEAIAALVDAQRKELISRTETPDRAFD